MIEYWIFSNEGLSLKTTALELFMGHRGSIAGYLPGVAGTRPRELRSKGPVGKFLLFDEIKILFFSPSNTNAGTLLSISDIFFYLVKRVNNRDEVAVCHFQRPFTFKTITRKNICYQYWSRYLQRVGNGIRIFGGLLLSKGSLLKVGTHKAVCRYDTSLRQTIPWKKVVQ